MRRLSLMLACLAVGGSGLPSTPSAPPTTAGPRAGIPNYTLTITASPACTFVNDSVTHVTLPFPEAARVRTYNAELRDTLLFVNGGGPYDATTTGRDLMVIVPPDANMLNSTTSPACDSDYWWDGFGASGPYGYVEHVNLCGTWHGRGDDRGQITGTIDGAMVYLKGVGPKFDTVLFCRAADHRFTLTTP